MSLFNYQTPVKYVCTCGELKSIARIYFCRHCSEIRCGFCVSHEVDARFCVTCVENIPLAEAWMKNNCCYSCTTCPVCHLKLTTRLTTVKNKEPIDTVEKEEGKSEEIKKFYYLCCFGCHWTSRDAGLPDQTTVSAVWPEFENPFAARINELTEYYKSVSLYDKTISEKKQPFAKRGYAHFTGMSAALVRRKAGLPMYAGGHFPLSGLQEVKKPPKIKGSVPSTEINDLPENIFTEAPDLMKVTTLQQRLGIPSLQCLDVSKLRPCKRLLLTKMSQRCRECEHNVTKPEFNPTSIKFKIQVSAYYHIPNVSIKKCDPLYPGKESDLYIHLVNPTSHQIMIQLLPFNTEIKKTTCAAEKEVGGGDADSTDEGKQSKNRKIPLKSDYQMKIEPRPVSVNFTGEPILPEAAVVLPGRDDAAEYDDVNENPNINNDDKEVVVWRKGNQAVLKFPIKPNENLESDSEVIIGFVMNHTYIITNIQDKSQQTINHKVRLILTAGKTV